MFRFTYVILFLIPLSLISQNQSSGKDSSFYFSADADNPRGIHIELGFNPNEQSGKVQVAIYLSKEGTRNGRFILAVGDAYAPATDGANKNQLITNPRHTPCENSLIPGWRFVETNVGNTSGIPRFCDLINDPYIAGLFLNELRIVTEKNSKK